MSSGGFVRPDIRSKPLGIIEFFRFLLIFFRLKLKTIGLTADVLLLLLLMMMR
jgi:hypothetical protein